MKLSEILDVEVPLPAPPANTALLIPDVSASANNTVEQDADDIRKNVRTLIAQGTLAVTELLALARDLKTPRAYEVASTMLKTMSELSQDLLTVHQQEQSLTQEDEPSITGDVNIGAVFVGSTTELGERIKYERRIQRDAKVIEVKAENVTDVQVETSQPEILPKES